MNTKPTMPIAIRGLYVGTVIDHELGVQFVARDSRVTDMDRSIWPSARYAEHAARQLFESAE